MRFLVTTNLRQERVKVLTDVLLNFLDTQKPKNKKQQETIDNLRELTKDVQKGSLVEFTPCKVKQQEIF